MGGKPFLLMFGIGLLLTGCLSLHAKSATDGAPVTIVVTDSSGAPIRYAQIKLAPQSATMPKNSETDETGKISLNVIPGKYNLFVTAPDFAPWSKSILVESNAGQTLMVTLQIVCATQTVRDPRFAPIASASIMITVTNATGAAVPFAQIGVCPVDEFSKAHDESDESGKFSLKLVPGDYDLVVTSPGFRRWTRHIGLKDKKGLIVNAILQVGGCLPGPCTTVESTH
jgi:hypothetical protein